MSRQFRTAEEILEEKSLRLLKKIRKAEDEQSKNYKSGNGPSVYLNHEINDLCHQWEKLFTNYGVLPASHPLLEARALPLDVVYPKRGKKKLEKDVKKEYK